MLRGDGEAIAAAQGAVGNATAAASAWESIAAQRAAVERELAAVMGEDAFAFVASRYNAAGARFAKAVATVEPDRDSDDVMANGTKAQREAFVAIPRIADELDSLAALLADVVRFCGGHSAARNYRTGDDVKHAAFPLGLLVKMNGTHPRRVAEAWYWRHSPPAAKNRRPPSALDRLCSGRGRRWTALVKLGAEIAVPRASLAAFEPFPLAEPFRAGGAVLDPYDGPAQMAAYEAHQAEQAKLAAGRRARVRRIGGIA